MKKAYLLALSLLAVPAVADNNRGFYLGVGASGISDEQEAPIDTTQIRAGELLGGYKYNAALGVELRLGTGLREGTGDDMNGEGLVTTTVERDIGNYQSIYYKPELVNDDAKLYALLGYTKMSTSGEHTTGAVVTHQDESYSGASYGIGIGFVINKQFNINFEYKNLCDDLYNKPNTASVNIDYRF